MKANCLTKETILNYGVAERNFPDFQVGDAIEVSLIIKEKNKERIQKFEGNVISDHKNGISSTFTVRKIGAASIGVEMILPYYSPSIESIKVLRQGKVRRAKLFYLRSRAGQKATKIKERRKVSAKS